MAIHSSVLAWRIPGMVEPGGLPSMGSHRVRHDWSDLAAAAAGKNLGGWGYVNAATKSLQSCPTLCDPIDGSAPGSPVPGILQARTLEWLAISFSNAWKWKVKVKTLSCAWLLATPWSAAYQAPPSMGFSRQEYWSGLPLPSLNAGTDTPKSQGFNSTDFLLPHVIVQCWGSLCGHMMKKGPRHLRFCGSIIPSHKASDSLTGCPAPGQYTEG